jgi:16S rRNA (cytosine967-C5)-methyltransferase
MSREDLTDAQPRGAKDPRLGRLHDRILSAYAEIIAGTPADRVLRNVFKKARDLGPKERSLVSDIVYALIRSQRTIDDRLDRALKAEGKRREILDEPIITRLRVLTYYAIQGATVEELTSRDSYAVKRIPKLFPRITANKLPQVKRTPLENLAITYSLPDFFVARLAERLGLARTEEVAGALLGRAPITLRVNRLRGKSREEVTQEIRDTHQMDAVATKLSPDGIILSDHSDLASWPLFEQGVIEPQDEGSQLLALALGAGPKETVLDGCAGAGGKTLALAAMMQNTGRVVALDPDPKKLEELRKRARRAGVTNMEAIEGSLEALPEKLRGTCDRVLVDAPCTGSGAYRRHPDARWRANEREVPEYAAKQQRLIAGAAGALKNGGVLAYATCSLLHEENEDVVDSTIGGDARLFPMRLEETIGAIARALELGPHGDRARIGPGPSDADPDGFFVALARRQ